MLNNAALDVAIGLVFIYAIYSLLATTITELVASIFSLRGVDLRKGISRMLDDCSPRKPLLSKIRLKKNESPCDQPEVVKLSGEFLKQPEIVYLSKRESKPPSYIKSKTFAKGFVNALFEKHGTKDLQEIKKKLQNSNSLTNKFILNLINEANDDILIFKSLAEDWFNETMERVSGWYKKRIQIITVFVGLIMSFSMSIDTIAIGQKLSQDKKTRLAMVEVASKYADGFVFADSLSNDNLEKINQLNNKVDSLLVQVQNSNTIMEISRPDNFGLWDDDNNVKESWLWIAGCFLTAIALSVGAPFWFDLLSRLINLRGAGIKESTQTKSRKNNPVG